MADKMGMVLELLHELVSDVDIGEARVKDIAEKLKIIYSDKTFRHSYAELSDEMGQFQPDQRDQLCMYVDKILGEFGEKLGESDFTTIRFGKLCDHINLECIRISRIERVEFIGEQSRKDLTEAGSDLEKTRAMVDELKSDVEGFHSQSITILGIFAGLVITFASITQLITSGITNLTNVDAYKVVLFVSVTFLFLFNIVFFLMYSIAKIAGKSIASRCEKRRCTACGACGSSIEKLYKKYPYFLWVNVVSIITCIASYFLNSTP